MGNMNPAIGLEPHRYCGYAAACNLLKMYNGINYILRPQMLFPKLPPNLGLLLMSYRFGDVSNYFTLGRSHKPQVPLHL